MYSKMEIYADVKKFTDLLEKLGYNFSDSEDSWKISHDMGRDECLTLNYQKDLPYTYEEILDLRKKLDKIFPEATEDAVFPFPEKLRLDFDKYYLPDTNTGICLWVYCYSEKHFGVCFSNNW